MRFWRAKDLITASFVSKTIIWASLVASSSATNWEIRLWAISKERKMLWSLLLDIQIWYPSWIHRKIFPKDDYLSSVSCKCGGNVFAVLGDNSPGPSWYPNRLAKNPLLFFFFFFFDCCHNFTYQYPWRYHHGQMLIEGKAYNRKASYIGIFKFIFNHSSRLLFLCQF